ncbi:class I SAM-dependent methyltransferase [Zavarzinella formosa]|uniref:class I SAM-dependent methyltransferase n=1 Tax=Zavarzinella formosa TaxID=360055 RepID=UPI0003150108|nr:class I SAM-dependent methyltransferase [Zavarzinella formosa]
MKATDRLTTEERFHDEQAEERARRFADLALLRFADEWYLNHEPWIRPAVGMLGSLAGKMLLDYGCGHGMASVMFARRGASVTGFDLSGKYVEEAKRRATANEVVAHFQVADAERLPFADASFDLVWGNAILHHLDMDQACKELKRILRPNGVAVFCEPWGGNPLLEFARRHLPYSGKHRTPDERPLRPADLPALRVHFPNLECRGHQFLGVLQRIWKRESPAGSWTDRLDSQLMSRFPVLEKWSRYVVLRLKNE